MSDTTAGSPAAVTSVTAATSPVASPAPLSSAEVADPRRPVLPVAPLEAAIEARGGLRACGMRYDPGADIELVRRIERLARAYLRARNRGYIGLYDADELAVDALGLHPAVVFGTVWWEPLAAPVAARDVVAAAG